MNFLEVNKILECHNVMTVDGVYASHKMSQIQQQFSCHTTTSEFTEKGEGEKTRAKTMNQT